MCGLVKGKSVKRFSTFGVLALLALVMLSACDVGPSQGTKNRTSAVSQREDNFARAQALYPAPNQTNFPIRKALVKYTERQDLENHPWYIYLLGMDGKFIGYFVGQTYPVNSCNFLSSSEEVRDDTQGNLILTAPSLDGIFYGGGGATSGCGAYFFFDATTDAMQTFVSPMWIAQDQPLVLPGVDIPRLNPEKPKEATPTANK